MDLYVSYQASGEHPQRARSIGCDVIKGRGAPKNAADVLDIIREIGTINGPFDHVILTFWAELPGVEEVSNDPT